MTRSPRISRHIRAAQGYLELGMFAEAVAELDQLPEEEREGELAVSCRLDLHIATKEWQKAAQIARDGVQRHPDCAHLYIMGAYAIRRAENSVEAAKAFLVKGHLCMDETKPERPLFWFNLGCYHSVLGNYEEAMDCLSMAVEGDDRFKKLALEDEDLRPMWDSLAVAWP